MGKTRDIPKPDAFKVCNSKIEIKAKNGKRVITGYASTNDIDAYSEVVEPTAFSENLPQYLEFPILLVNHEYYDKPIGKIAVAEVRDDGLYIEAEISKTVDGNDIWTLIQDGVLKAFSIGFNRIAHEEDEETGVTTITKLRLLEISIVNIPANSQALIQSAEQRGLHLFNHETKQHTNKEVHDMDQEETKKLIDAEVKAKSVEVAASAASSAEKALTPKLESLKAGLEGEMAAIRTVAEGCVTQADKKELEAKIMAKEAEFKAMIEKLQRDYAASQRSEYFVMPEIIEDDAKNHPLGEDFGRKLYTPSAQWGCHKEQHEEWCQALNQLAFVYTCMKGGKHFHGIKNLKSFAKFEKIDIEFSKAISATLASYGDEWTPTLLAANIIPLIETEMVIGGLFPVVPMPSNPWINPIISSHPSIYIYGEPTVDYADAIRRSSMTSSSRTLTAIGFAGASLISRDATEDSIIASVPLLQQQLVTAWARAKDDAILNGDTTATHRDTQHSMTAYDHRHAFDGLRHLANADSKEYNCQTVSEPNTALWEPYDIMRIIALHGNVAANLGSWASNLVLIMSLQKFLKAMMWTKTMTYGEAGPSNTLQVGPGAIPRMFGIPVLTSEFIRDDYASTGLYTGAADTTSVCLSVYKPSFIRGSRRAFELESEKIIDTQQIKVVGTCREAYREWRALTTEYVCVAGINIPA